MSLLEHFGFTHLDGEPTAGKGLYKNLGNERNVKDQVNHGALVLGESWMGGKVRARVKFYENYV